MELHNLNVRFRWKVFPSDLTHTVCSLGAIWSGRVRGKNGETDGCRGDDGLDDEYITTSLAAILQLTITSN